MVCAVGCTGSSAGQPLPTGGSPTQASVTTIPRSGASSSHSTSTRPREIRLDGKDPCALIPESDWPRFHIEKPGELRQQEPNFNSPDCFYSNDFLALGVTLVITEGIGEWIDGDRNGVVEQVVPIEQFPAISITRNGDQYHCNVAVDVADGQYLLVTVEPIISKVSELPERCELAHQVAESAMKTLVRL